jgi:hypothetical protein
LAQARGYNHASTGITGILCSGDVFCTGGTEGGRNQIPAGFTAINATRHKDVVLLHFEEIDELIFSGWSIVGQRWQNLAIILLKYSKSAGPVSAVSSGGFACRQRPDVCVDWSPL